jgi:hypothetical protein
MGQGAERRQIMTLYSDRCDINSGKGAGKDILNYEEERKGKLTWDPHPT